MIKCLSRLRKGEQGVALIAVLIMTTVGSLLIVPTLNFVSTSVRTGEIFEEKLEALYAADAGFEDAIWKIMNDPPENYPYSYQLLDVNGKTVLVTIEEAGITYKLTSAATTDSGSQTIIESHVMHPLSIYDFATATLDGDLVISGNTTLQSSPDPDQADIYSSGNILLQGGADVYGDATAGGNVDITGSSVVWGYVTQNAPDLEFPPMDTSEYLLEANGGTQIHGNLEINESQILGPAHIYGDLTITSDAIVTLTGTVWVDGEITCDGSTHVEGAGTLLAEGNIVISGGGELLPENIPVIISTAGNIETAGNQVVAAVLYAPSGTATIAGKAGLFGSIVADSVSIETKSTLSYAIALKERNPREGELIIVAWQIK